MILGFCFQVLVIVPPEREKAGPFQALPGLLLMPQRLTGITW